MRVIVTGAAGFVGRAVVQRLGREHDVVATDIALATGEEGVAGDLRDPTVRARLFSQGCDAVVHLATIPGGAAEAAPDLAWSVNVDGTRALAVSAADLGTCPRFVFASSIAVFGATLPALVNDDTPLRPQMLYGGHKALMETWLATLSRRGALSALSLRLPGIVARPNAGPGFKSAFMSDVFHAIGAGRSYTVPVSPGATMWLMSVQQVAHNIHHALTLPDAAMPPERAVTLPAIRTDMAHLVSAIARRVGAQSKVDFAPDEHIESLFGSLPVLGTASADALGFTHDGDVEALVANALEEL